MNRRQFRSLRSWALTGVAAAAIASPAWAQEARRFDIPQQSLVAALEAFGKQGEAEILFSRAQAEGHATPGVSGNYEPAQALAMLLDGSGLKFRQVNGNTYVVEAAAPQSGSAAGDGAEGTVQALIVTAQKREENIQDVPIAMSAFTQEALERSQIAGGPDLITQVPNMTFTKTNFSSYSIQLRGIGTQAISATTDPGVAVAFNNTPFIQNRFFEQEFYDLQRVEVLRGPQGTLYGRNATAGVVNIISQKPKFTAEAKLSGDVANFKSTRLEGMVNIPLVEDKVALRLAGAWTKRNGYSTNELTGSPIDGRDLWSTRVSLRFAPTDTLDANLIWEHFQEDDDRLRSGKQLCKKDVVTQVGDIPVTSFQQRLVDNNISAPWVAVQPRFSQGCIRESLYSPDSFQTPNGASVPYYLPLGGIGGDPAFFDPYANQTQSRDLRVIESTVDPIYRAKADLGELQVSWDVADNLTLASETAYSADFVYSLEDFNRFNTVPGAFDYTSLNGMGTIAKGVLDENGFFTDPQLGRTNRLVAVDLSTQKSRQFSQEFRLSSDFDGSLNFSLGANFLRYDTEAKYYVFINSLTLTSANNTFAFLSPEHPYVSGETDNHQCANLGLLSGDPNHGYGYTCVYIEQNPINSIQDQGHNYFLSKNPYKLISYAAFGEVYYNITDNLKLTGGLRWTVDKKEAPRIPSWTLVGSGTVGYPVLEVIEQEWREPTGRLAIDWKPDLAFTGETLLYASYAHGYKAGGANPPPFVNPLCITCNFGGQELSATRPKTFDPEFVNAYELGAKNTLLDGKATLNLAAFYYDYKGYQISEIVDRSAFNQNYDATVWGLEVEADWRPLENLRLGFKGGYEDSRIKDGERAVDLMDRTAGNPDWVVVRPFPTSPSSCILPTALFTHDGTLPRAPGQPGIELTGLNPFNQIYDLGGGGGNASGGCEFAYLADLDPVTALPYDPSGYPTVSGSNAQLYHWPVGTYPGWNPEWAPNHGEGFYKDLGGNQLPNAPHFTGTVTVDYTLPLPNQWLMTLHTDLYAQSNAYWRIFNDHAFDKLHPYFTMNLAAIFTNEDAGWKVMAYVKNVLDRDSITGAFLNSDDTGLTTNVFLTEPRLYGLRVTKEWTGGPLWGSFGSRHDGPYPLTVELGGQVQRHDAPNEALTPSFMGEFPSAAYLLDKQKQDLDWGDGREIKLTWQPTDMWKVALAARVGKTNGSAPRTEWSEIDDSGFYAYVDYLVSGSTDREEHTIVDFSIGKDVGVGLMGRGGSSSVAAGLRYASFGSTTTADMVGITHWYSPTPNKYYPIPITHDRYVSHLAADREFKGAGPMLSWEASRALFGDSDTGMLGLDWSVSGGVLFGKRQTSIVANEVAEHFATGKYDFQAFPAFPATTTPKHVSIRRSESATVPNLGATLGLSYKVDRFQIGAGYRWERYQDAIDGGYARSKKEDRTIDGPYFKVSVGFGS